MVKIGCLTEKLTYLFMQFPNLSTRFRTPTRRERVSQQPFLQRKFSNLRAEIFLRPERTQPTGVNQPAQPAAPSQEADPTPGGGPLR